MTSSPSTPSLREHLASPVAALAAGVLAGFALRTLPGAWNAAAFGAGLGLGLTWIPRPEEDPGVLFLGGLLGLSGWVLAFVPLPWISLPLSLFQGVAVALLARTGLGEGPIPEEGDVSGWGPLGAGAGVLLSLLSPGVFLWLGGLLALLAVLGFLEERRPAAPLPEGETGAPLLPSSPPGPLRLPGAALLVGGFFLVLVRSCDLPSPGGARVLLLALWGLLLWMGVFRWGIFSALCFRHRAFVGGAVLAGGSAFVLAGASSLLNGLGGRLFPGGGGGTPEFLLLGLLLGGQGVVALLDRFPRLLVAAGLALGAGALGGLSGIWGVPSPGMWGLGCGAFGLGLGLVLESSWRIASGPLGPVHRASALRWYAAVLLGSLGAGRILAPAEFLRTSALFLRQMGNLLDAPLPSPDLLQDLLGRGAEQLAYGRCLALGVLLLLLLFPLLRLLPSHRR